MSQSSALPGSHKSNDSNDSSAQSFASSSNASDSDKRAGSLETHSSNQTPRPPNSRTVSNHRKPVPSVESSPVLDQMKGGHSAGSAPPTPPPSHPLPPIPSPTASNFPNEPNDNRNSRVAGSQSSHRSSSSNRGLGLSRHSSREELEEDFARQADKAEDSSSQHPMNPSQHQIRARLAKQSRNSAKSISSEASTDTFGIFSDDQIPPPVPTNSLAQLNSPQADSSSRIPLNRSLTDGGSQTSQTRFGRNLAESELQMRDSDDDDDDYNDYSDDSDGEMTEQAHVSALPPSTLGSNLQRQKSNTNRGRNDSRAEASGFPLPPPRGESLISERTPRQAEEGFGDRRMNGASSLQKPSEAQGSTFEERLAQLQGAQSPSPAANRRAAGSLSASRPQPSTRPSSYAKTSASSSLTEVPVSGRRRRGLQDDTVDDDDLDPEGERSFYKRSKERSNLGEWAPAATPAKGLGIANLPDWDALRAGEPTSKPISQVKRDMDWSLKKLISPQIFEQLLADPLGRHRFREYLVRAEGTEAKLDMLFDLTQYSKTIATIKATAEALHDIYLVGDSPTHQNLPGELDDQVFGSLKKTFELKVSMEDAQSHLLQSLFKNEFQDFIKNQVIETTKVKLGESIDPNDLDGLGNCYCLTNPRLRENPIVLISDGFTSVTGYSRQAIIGRNCRFLQGPSTNDAAVGRIRQALNNAEPITELLLNYRKDGTPFWCLLNIIPLREANGQLAYFIGGQTNVTGTLASSKGLSFLLSSNQDTNVDTEMAKNNGIEISSTMARHLGISHSAGVAFLDTNSVLSAGSGKNLTRSERSRSARAAGSYNPAEQDLVPMGMLDSQLKNPGKKNGFFNKMFSGKSNGDSASSKVKKQAQNGMDGNYIGQKLEGAEMKDLRYKEANTLEDQMDYFTQQSSKLLILRRQKREVLFATGDLISFFGLPTQTASQLLSSPLVHADFLSLLCGGDKSETKALRAHVGQSISKGNALTIEVGIRQPSKKRFGSSSNDNIIKYTTMFLTPLKDRENASYALVALFA